MIQAAMLPVYAFAGAVVAAGLGLAFKLAWELWAEKEPDTPYHGGPSD